MKNPPLVKGTLLARPQRFLATVKLENGQVINAACNHSGSMRTCFVPGSRVMLSVDNNPNRRHPHTWELIEINGVWVCVNTFVPNRLVHRAVKKGLIPELSGYNQIQTEVKISDDSRIDLMLSRLGERCYVEVKSVTMVENGIAYFPDAVTSRGLRHLEALTKLIEQGHRTVLFFVVQRNDATLFRPAYEIDPSFSLALKTAHERGVEILVYRADVSVQEINLGEPLPFDLTPPESHQ
ncbi:MAG: DNA/RNA nuclease SfsA [candidate division KSB1 bacterium]|nr:DNA/RNA nuclease SfsA [candidate division KSB1 bacterium]